MVLRKAAHPNGKHSVKPITPPWWLGWATNPYAALKLLVLPVVLSYGWDLATPHVAPGSPNPLTPLFRLSGYVEDSHPDDPRYAKDRLDLAFLVYYIVFFSFCREYLALKVSLPLARYFGLKKQGKIDRFAEQLYAVVYFSVSGVAGYYVMSQLPIFWYKTDEFWRGYPHWDMKPSLKRYYLMQSAYWCQQFIVLVLGLEKPRKDYHLLVAHHFITLWLVGWSYVANLTYIGCAVYLSMDIPDAFFANSKLLNYIDWKRAKIVSFVTFVGIWTYFRHYLNFKILWSVWTETKLVPDFAKAWDWKQGVYMTWWLPIAIFGSIFALQLLNLYWYYLILKIFFRALVTRDADDDRSDDEDDGEIEGTSSTKDD